MPWGVLFLPQYIGHLKVLSYWSRVVLDNYSNSDIASAVQRDFYEAEAEEAVCQTLSDTVGSSAQISHTPPHNSICHFNLSSLLVHRPMLLCV